MADEPATSAGHSANRGHELGKLLEGVPHALETPMMLCTTAEPVTVAVSSRGKDSASGAWLSATRTTASPIAHGANVSTHGPVKHYAMISSLSGVRPCHRWSDTCGSPSLHSMYP